MLIHESQAEDILAKSLDPPPWVTLNIGTRIVPIQSITFVLSFRLGYFGRPNFEFSPSYKQNLQQISPSACNPTCQRALLQLSTLPSLPPLITPELTHLSLPVIPAKELPAGVTRFEERVPKGWPVFKRMVAKFKSLSSGAAAAAAAASFAVEKRRARLMCTYLFFDLTG
jgi:hypothetical protein